MTLEAQLVDDILSGRDIDIERGILIASGCGEKQIAEYKAKLEQLQEQFKEYISGKDTAGLVERAKAIHEFVWDGICYTPRGRILLYPEALDARIYKQPIGENDCAGASPLCAMLGLKNGITFRVLLRPEHVMLRLKAERTVDINCISPSGFDINSSRCYSGLKEYGLIALMSAAFNNRGCRYGNCRLRHKARNMFTWSIAITPNATAYRNRATAKEAMGDWAGYAEDMQMYRELAGETE